MAQGAYCNGCARRVQLTDQGECPQGHLRSLLRDVRQDEVVPTETPAPHKASHASRPSGPSQPHELLSLVIGKAFVFVPLAAILAFGLWAGYEEGVGSGMSVGVALLMSLGSLALTVGIAFVWASMRRRRS